MKTDSLGRTDGFFFFGKKHVFFFFETCFFLETFFFLKGVFFFLNIFLRFSRVFICSIEHRVILGNFWPYTNFRPLKFFFFFNRFFFKQNHFFPRDKLDKIRIFCICWLFSFNKNNICVL